jgi:L-ascorbate metabolism protein UlaG (beta-lactamase superfamily)
MHEMRIAPLLFILFTAAFLRVHAQRPQPDIIPTKAGNITIQPITHGSVVLTWNKKTIYVDPYGGIEGYKGLAAPDLILITDLHPDHMDIRTLEAINTAKAKIIAPPAVFDKMTAALRKKTMIVKNGGKTKQLGASIRAIPMYNLPESREAMHPKGRGNGYVLNIGGKNIYFSGDTGDIAEMRSLKGIDVAFVCMNLPYTMDIEHASSGVLAFKPKIVYPYHYRGKGGLSDIAAFKKMVNISNSNIEVRLRNWYPTAE